MDPLNSSNLAGCSYDPEAKTLTVFFRSGAEYEYRGVDADTYEALKSASSPGEFFARSIKSRFSTTRVG